ncbi:MAG: DinB family protein [bacterium]|nr:DinB family protein [Candidatus Kapabacteria bacterium]
MTESFLSQYRASLTMLRTAIENYPDELWLDQSFVNPAWRIAYHALYYTHLYLTRTEEEFVPWEHAIAEANHMGEPLKEGAAPHPRESILEYLDWIYGFVPVGLSNKPFDSSSGFDWITMNRGQLHIYNLRHLQHHMGQLAERLKSEADVSIDWVGRIG